MRTTFIVKNFVTLLLMLWTTPVCAQAPAAPAQARAPEIECSASGVQQRLPVKVRIKVLSVNELEAKGYDKADVETPASTMRRFEAPDQSGAAAFQMGGMLGVSGNAKLLISQTALQFGEIGTILIINSSTRESVAYGCSKLP